MAKQKLRGSICTDRKRKECLKDMKDLIGDKWINIKDRSPKEDHIVFVWSDGFGCSQRRFRNGKFYYENIPESYDKKVTHWRPLFDPPTNYKSNSQL